MAQPRWNCFDCEHSNSYWTAKCKKCGLTVAQHTKKKNEATKQPLSTGPIEVPGSVENLQAAWEDLYIICRRICECDKVGTRITSWTIDPLHKAVSLIKDSL